MTGCDLRQCFANGRRLSSYTFWPIGLWHHIDGTDNRPRLLRYPRLLRLLKAFSSRSTQTPVWSRPLAASVQTPERTWFWHLAKNIGRFRDQPSSPVRTCLAAAYRANYPIGNGRQVLKCMPLTALSCFLPLILPLFALSQMTPLLNFSFHCRETKYQGRRILDLWKSETALFSLARIIQ